MQPKNEIVKREAKPPAIRNNHGLVLTNLDDMWRYATAAYDSGLCPDSIKNYAQAFIVIQTGAEIGLKPQQSFGSIYIVNNKPTLWGDAALALCRASVLCESVVETISGEGDKMVGKCVVKRKGQEEPIIRTYSVAEATAAGLMSRKPWQLHTRRRLHLRARSYALRDAFPDVLMGLHLTEEEQDVDPGMDHKFHALDDMPVVAHREDKVKEIELKAFDKLDGIIPDVTCTTTATVVDDAIEEAVFETKVEAADIKADFVEAKDIKPEPVKKKRKSRKKKEPVEDVPDLPTEEESKPEPIVELNGHDDVPEDGPKHYAPRDKSTIKSSFLMIKQIVKEALPDDVDDEMIKAVIWECAAFQFPELGNSEFFSQNKALWTLQMMDDLMNGFWNGEDYVLPLPVVTQFGLNKEVGSLFDD